MKKIITIKLETQYILDLLLDGNLRVGIGPDQSVELVHKDKRTMVALNKVFKLRAKRIPCRHDK